jgi:hypothetical protein
VSTGNRWDEHTSWVAGVPEPKVDQSRDQGPYADGCERVILEPHQKEVFAMRTLVAYESMYGNTHLVAEAIADGLAAVLGPDSQVRVSSLELDAVAPTEELDLVVVGGPTHVHGMSQPRTRAAAVQRAVKEDLPMDESAPGSGLVEWLSQAQLPRQPCWSAAFDTRAEAPALVTGRASPKIQRRLQQRGLPALLAPESFFVDRHSRLRDGELHRARDWGRRLAYVLRDEAATAAGR